MQNNLLNTMDSFKDGFRIERDGKTITLTSEEMFDLLYLRKSLEGRQFLTDYENVATSKEKEVIQKLKEDEEICFNIADSVQCKLDKSLTTSKLATFQMSKLFNLTFVKNISNLINSHLYQDGFF